MTDLNSSIFDYCIALAKKRESKWSKKLKQNYHKTIFNRNYELIGLLGEIIYGLYSGELLDVKQYQSGDDGADFNKRVQVKTSEVIKAKYLIEYTDKDFSKFDYFVMVLVDLENKSGYVKSWISTKDFLKRKTVMDFGYGKRYAMKIEEMNPCKKGTEYISSL